MPKAVQYRRFGGVDVLEVADVPRPSPGPGQALVAVRTTGINPGEARIRQGEFAQRWPSTFPSGQGSDLAGSQMPLVPQGRSNEVVIRHGGIVPADLGNPTDRRGDNHASLSRGLQIATQAE